MQTLLNLAVPLRDPYLQTGLYHKKGRMILQILRWLQQLKVVVAEQHWEKFVHLQQSQVLADAQMAATAKLFTSSVELTEFAPIGFGHSPDT